MTSRRALALGAISFALSLTAACTIGDPTGDLIPATVEETTFAASLNVDLTKSIRTANGAYVRDFVVGTGPLVNIGDSISVRYTGWLADGTQFDSNVTMTVPYPFRVGTGTVIEGWDEGIPGMHVGGTRQILIPPGLGYGYSDYYTIPGNSVLVFSVQVVGNP
jgi:FKBP-type peptidyl-prolyl cis-trans isomerase